MSSCVGTRDDGDDADAGEEVELALDAAVDCEEAGVAAEDTGFELEEEEVAEALAAADDEVPDEEEEVEVVAGEVDGIITL